MIKGRIKPKELDKLMNVWVAIRLYKLETLQMIANLLKMFKLSLFLMSFLLFVNVQGRTDSLKCLQTEEMLKKLFGFDFDTDCANAAKREEPRILDQPMFNPEARNYRSIDDFKNFLRYQRLMLKMGK